MKKIIFLILLSLTATAQKAINFDNPRVLNDSIFDAIADYKIIWIGEMHGGNEAAAFAEGIVDLLLKYKRNVSFGFEIKEEDIYRKGQKLNKTTVLQTEYAKTYETRANETWANLLIKMNNTKHVKPFYFDYYSEIITNQQRDSLMAVNILQKWDKKSTLVILSGNLHNKLKTSNGIKKAALFLVESSQGNISKSDILSLNHIFLKGQIVASYEIDNGLKLNSFDSSKSQWAQSPIYNSNHLFISNEIEDGWNGHFFTKEVTPVILLKSEK